MQAIATGYLLLLVLGKTEPPDEIKTDGYSSCSNNSLGGSGQDDFSIIVFRTNKKVMCIRHALWPKGNQPCVRTRSCFYSSRKMFRATDTEYLTIQQRRNHVRTLDDICLQFMTSSWNENNNEMDFSLLFYFSEIGEKKLLYHDADEQRRLHQQRGGPIKVWGQKSEISH